jgi:hypothetical protein
VIRPRLLACMWLALAAAVMFAGCDEGSSTPDAAVEDGDGSDGADG